MEIVYLKRLKIHVFQDVNRNYFCLNDYWITITTDLYFLIFYDKHCKLENAKETHLF